MKKRMFSILLTLCMVLSLLPTTALADGGDITGEARAGTYAELVSCLSDPDVTTLYIEGQQLVGIEDDGNGNITEVYTPFVWPSGEAAIELDLMPANTACSMYVTGGEWTIPENVTVNAYRTVYCSNAMVINGTWNCMSNQAIIGNISGSDGLYGSLTVNGTLTVAENLRVSPAQVGSFTLNGTLENAGVCYINHMAMADGAEVVNIPNPEIVNSVREIYLVDGGSITGPGTGSASIGGVITVHGAGTLSGNLTVDQITLYSGSTLTVADGADVTIDDLTCNGTSSSPAAMNVNGKLSVTTDGYNTVRYTTITLGKNGVLALSPNVQFGSSSSYSTIEGEGTLELYGILDEDDNCSQAPVVFSVSSKRIDNATGEYVPLTGVSDSVNVVRMWTQCQSHSWCETTTVAPTCGDRGYDTATCSECGMEKRSNYVPATGAHTVYFTKRNDSYVDVNCSVCGGSNSIYITAEDTVYEEGKAAETAELNGDGLEWLDADEIPAIVYTNNTAPGTATASATFVDVTISATFEIAACAHVEGSPATCISGPICSECGEEYGEPLGHTGGTATCKEQATCTRCGEKYGNMGYHTYVLKSNAEIHWVECSACSLEYLQDYGLDVTSPSQIPDKVLLELIYTYLDQQDGGTKDQFIYLEKYGDTPSKHACSDSDFAEGDVCLLCGYGATACSHSWNDGEVTTAPTCTGRGVRTYTCTACGETKTEDIPAAGHTEVTDSAVAATCTETGLTEGKHCSVCSEVLVAQIEVPAAGHTEAVDAAVEPTCTATGLTEGKHCSVCGTVIVAQETINELGHIYSDTVTEPTCEAQGHTTHTCSRCDDSYVDTYVPALGHDWSTNDCAQAATCSRCDATRNAGTHVCTYTASGAVLTETCNSCDHSATATLSVSGGSFSYTGTAITPASVAYGTGWQSGDLTIAYSNNTLAGTATASVTLGGATATVSFAISPASQTLNWSAAGNLVTAYGTPITGKTAVNDKADGGAVTYTSDNSNVAAVDSAGTLTIVGVGEAKITASAPAVEGKYTASAPIEYYVTVSAKRVTVTADVKTRTYGSENPALTFTVPEGILVGSDTAADLGVTLVTQANLTSPVGEYDITGSGSSTNYAVTVTPGTLTVTPASLTVKPKDVTIYVGDALPTQLELAYTGLVNGDTLTPAGTLAFTLKNGDAELADSKTAGTYTILWTNPDEVTFDNANYSVTKETTGTLTISQTSSGGGDGEEGSATVIPDEPEITTGGGITVAEIETDATTSGTVSKATVSHDALDEAIKAAESAAGKAGTDAAVEIVVNTPAKATEVKVDLPAEGLENFADSEAQSLTISSGVGTVTISPEAAASIAGQAQGDTVTVTISKVTQPEMALNERQLAAVGDAPVYDLSITSNGKYVTDFDGGLITVSLPYALKEGEDPNGVVVYYVDDLGNIQRVRTMYDVKTQSILFTTNHFSFYMVCYESDTAAAARFTDVPFDAYYLSAVGWAVSHGVSSGVTETTFAPDAPCTRAQAVTFLWRAAGSPAPKSSVNPFADVKADAYYCDAVLWAVEQGITRGTSDTTFSPNAACTRGQIVTFLWRSQKSPPAGGVNPFTDVVADAYYAEAVLWAAENEITGGTTATTFNPNSNCTRAQIVTFLFRCLGE